MHSLRDERIAETLRAWATVKSSDERGLKIFTWFPPVPLVITGFHFSAPVVVREIRRALQTVAVYEHHPLLRQKSDWPISPLSMEAVADVELLPISLMLGEQLVLLLQDDTTASVTLRWSERELTRYLTLKESWGK